MFFSLVFVHCGKEPSPMGINRYLVKSTFVSALGGLLFGFDTAVIAGTTHQLTEVYRLTPYLLGLTVSSALWGTVAGAMTAGYPGQRIGRRDSLRIMAVFLFSVGAGLRVCMELGIAARLPHHRRLRHWRVVGTCAYVYCGAVPGEVAWASGGFLSDKHCCGHSAGVLVELPD